MALDTIARGTGNVTETIFEEPPTHVQELSVSAPTSGGKATRRSKGVAPPRARA
jgi:UDP-N-acetylglucosamine enolpyruvyl transferase